MTLLETWADVGAYDMKDENVLDASEAVASSTLSQK